MRTSSTFPGLCRCHHLLFFVLVSYPTFLPPSPPIFTDSLKYFWHRAWVETAIVHLETVARVETRDHTDQPVTQVDTMMMVVMMVVVVAAVVALVGVRFYVF